MLPVVIARRGIDQPRRLVPWRGNAHPSKRLPRPKSKRSVELSNRLRVKKTYAFFAFLRRPCRLDAEGEATPRLSNSRLSAEVEKNLPVLAAGVSVQRGGDSAGWLGMAGAGRGARRASDAGLPQPAGRPWPEAACSRFCPCQGPESRRAERRRPAASRRGNRPRRERRSPGGGRYPRS